MRVGNWTVALAVLGSASVVLGGVDFVPDPLRSNVLVVDTDRMAIAAKMPTLEPSRDVIYDRGTGRLYIANTGWVRPDIQEPGFVSILSVPETISGNDASPVGAFLDRVEVLANIKVGAAPIDIALDNAGERLFVANIGDDSVSVIDTRRLALLNTFPLAGRPSGVAFHEKTGDLIVSRQQLDDIVILDPLKGEITDVVQVGRRPFDVVIAQEANLAFVANGSDDTVSIVDLPTSSVTGTLEVGSRPVDLTMVNRDELLVTNLLSTSVSRVSIREKRVVGTLHFGHALGGIVVSDAHPTLFGTFKRGDVYVGNPTGTAIESVLRQTHIPELTQEALGK